MIFFIYPLLIFILFSTEKSQIDMTNTNFLFCREMGLDQWMWDIDFKCNKQYKHLEVHIGSRLCTQFPHTWDCFPSNFYIVSLFLYLKSLTKNVVSVMLQTSVAKGWTVPWRGTLITESQT